MVGIIVCLSWFGSDDIHKPEMYIRDHPFKTSACLRVGGVKNWPKLPTDSSKKLPTEGG